MAPISTIFGPNESQRCQLNFAKFSRCRKKIREDENFKKLSQKVRKSLPGLRFRTKTKMEMDISFILLWRVDDLVQQQDSQRNTRSVEESNCVSVTLANGGSEIMSTTFSVFGNFDRSFTRQTWPVHPSNFVKTRFRRFPTFHFSTPKFFSWQNFYKNCRGRFFFKKVRFWRGYDF